MVDFWAFSTEEGEWGREIMSMHHTRNALQRLTPRVGPWLPEQCWHVKLVAVGCMESTASVLAFSCVSYITASLNARPTPPSPMQLCIRV